jgi:hypothetical protein
VLGLFALLACASLLGAWPSSARAVILPAVTIDGPSEEIVGFGGAAMAEDGTGGVVYLKRVGGVPHLFVSRLARGSWLPPIQVDTGEPFAAASPRIGAANGGELVVVWSTPYATSPTTGRPVYELLGAVLGPGGESFGQAAIVDKDIEEAIGTSPALAVSSTGQADVVYRVVSRGTQGISPLRAGDVKESVRVAHFNGLRWLGLGAVNRNPAIGMRPPSAANEPAIAIGPTGNGVVAWQEPDIEGVARIWARRIFGTSLDYVMPATLTSYSGAAVTDDADAPAVAFSRLGQGELAYRQAAGPASSLPGPRIMLNILPDGESANGAQFQGAVVADSAVSGGKAAVVGAPSIDIDEQQDMRLLYDSNGSPRVIEGSDRGLIGALTLGSPFAGSEASAASVMNPQGGGVSAWPSQEAQGHPAVAVREDFPGGAVQTGLLAGGSGGEVAELSVGRSGLGDGLVAFRQGPLGDAAIVASLATAPPEPFVVTLPKGWVRPRGAAISWLPAPSAATPIVYQLVLDGHPRGPRTAALQASLDPRGLGSGRHRLQVLAIDRNGQSTLSAPSELLIDGSPPSIALVRRGSSLTVRVSDPDSGVSAASVSVSFGDGSSVHGRLRLAHRFARAGVYRVLVRARDRLGNAIARGMWVSVP